jgi:hypothetical protein
VKVLTGLFLNSVGIIEAEKIIKILTASIFSLYKNIISVFVEKFLSPETPAKSSQ